MVSVLGLCLQNMCMIMIFVFHKILGDKRLYVIKYAMFVYINCLSKKKTIVVSILKRSGIDMM